MYHAKHAAGHTPACASCILQRTPTKSLYMGLNCSSTSYAPRAVPRPLWCSLVERDLVSIAAAQAQKDDLSPLCAGSTAASAPRAQSIGTSGRQSNALECGQGALPFAPVACFERTSLMESTPASLIPIFQCWIRMRHEKRRTDGHASRIFPRRRRATSL